MAAVPAATRPESTDPSAEPVPITIVADERVPVPIQAGGEPPAVSSVQEPAVSLPTGTPPAGRGEVADRQIPILASPGSTTRAHHLPVAPVITLTPDDVLAVQRHPTVKSSDFAPAPVKPQAPTPTPVSNPAPTPAVAVAAPTSGVPSAPAPVPAVSRQPSASQPAAPALVELPATPATVELPASAPAVRRLPGGPQVQLKPN